MTEAGPTPKQTATLRYAWGAFLTAVTMLSSCVYYNTFYNALEQFEKGERTRIEAETKQDDERLQSQFLQHYDIAIRKASVILAHHSDSKWVDDSLLLIGKASFWLGKYEDDDGALLKFEELRENFPESELVSEARYWEGRTLKEAGRFEEARRVLTEVGMGNHPDLAPLAMVALAELEVEEGFYGAAVDVYERLLEGQRPRKSMRALIWKSYGDALLRQGHTKEALTAYSEVLDSSPGVLMDYETRAQIGAAYEAREEFGEALKTYAGVRRAKHLRLYEPEARLKEANVIRLMGLLDRAVALYGEIAEAHPRTVYSGRALYETAMIEQRDRGNLKAAEELFEKARDEKRNAEVAQLAEQRRRDLGDLARYRDLASGGDVDAIGPLFSMAELYLFNIGPIDSALSLYRRALDLAPDSSEYAPKALFAVGLIQADSLGDRASATATFEKLVERFPTSPYGLEARRRLGREDHSDPAAAEAFQEAERVMQSGDVAGYLQLLERLAADFPKSEYAPRALFALAWTYENDLDQLETAEARYRELVTKYPLSEAADVAMDKLGGGYLAPLPPPGTTESDSITAGDVSDDTGLTTSPEAGGSLSSQAGSTSSQDSVSSMGTGVRVNPNDTHLSEGEVDVIPVLVGRVPADFPSKVNRSVKEAEVVVKALVGTDGRVVQAQPVRGPLKFQEAALEAALQYRFRPGRHGGTPRSVWVELTISFKRGEVEG